MTIRNTPPPAILSYIRENFSYDAETGVLTRLSTGRPVGWAKPSGYILVSIYRSGRACLQLRAHCICWFLATGEWPPADMDVEHENRDRADNRWRNLSLKRRAENVWNQGVCRDNKLGVKGVVRTPSGRFRAQISRDGLYRYLGLYGSAEEAQRAYIAAGGVP